MNPTYVRVTIKGKILQLTLPCEVSVEKSNVRRNTITGNLVIGMARLIPCKTIVGRDESVEKGASKREKKILTVRPPVTSRRALLEIGPPSDLHDFLMVTKRAQTDEKDLAKEEKSLENFEDNPDVPPLE